MVPGGVAGTRPSALTRRRVIILFVLVAGLVVSGLYAAHARGADARRCERFAAASEARAAIVTGTGERVVVIGDSYSVGLRLAHPSRSWPSRLDGRVRVAGFSGSGFSQHASTCARSSFADRAPAAVRGGADLVVVEGGLNDVDRTQSEIRSGFARLMRTLKPYRVVVVGPPPAPSRAPAVPRVDRILRLLAQEHGVSYVATSDLQLTYHEDRLHLTPSGHREFGDAVAERIAALR